jgi:hypothetical protein
LRTRSTFRDEFIVALALSFSIKVPSTLPAAMRLESNISERPFSPRCRRRSQKWPMWDRQVAPAHPGSARPRVGGAVGKSMLRALRKGGAPATIVPQPGLLATASDRGVGEGCGRRRTRGSDRSAGICDALNLSHLFRREVFAHTMAQNSAAIPPLLKADTATLTFSASKDGKLRGTYAEWDDARACASGAMVERGAP